MSEAGIEARKKYIAAMLDAPFMPFFVKWFKKPLLNGGSISVP